MSDTGNRDASDGAPVPPYVVNDMVIEEDNCNLTCSYCLTGQSVFKMAHAAQKIFEPPRRSSCGAGTALGTRMRTVMRRAAEQAIPVLKLSGGEVMIIDGIMDFIGESCERYETVVLLSNGTRFDDGCVRRLEAQGNVVIQLSLDATCYPGNSYRVRSESMQRALMKRVRRVLESELAVEIYTVLHDRSVETLAQTLDDLAPYGGKVRLFAFPARGPDHRRYAVRADQLHHLEAIVERAAEYGDLLPQGGYLDRLVDFLRAGRRTTPCHLPRIAFTSFDDGTVTSCPNIWFNRAGSLLTEDPDTVFTRLREAPFRRLLLAPRPRVNACRACFTPWEPISMYFEGHLDDAALAAVPVYRGPRTRALLATLRRQYRGEDCRA